MTKLKKSAFLSHFVAHYADIEHEILEVKSGYRLALIYSLCWENGNGLNFDNINRKEFKSLFSQMRSSFNVLTDNDNDNHYGILLVHSYTDSALKSHGI